MKRRAESTNARCFRKLTSRSSIFSRRSLGARDIDAFALHHDRPSAHLRVDSRDILPENSDERQLYAGQKEQSDDHSMGPRRSRVKTEEADDEGERSIQNGKKRDTEARKAANPDRHVAERENTVQSLIYKGE